VNKEILNAIGKKWIFLVLILAIICGIFYWCSAPAIDTFDNIKKEQQLQKEIKQKNEDLERIIEDNKRKNEAAKSATVKEFYKVEGMGSGTDEDFAPMLDNMLAYMKQDGIRIKSIKNSPNPTDDNLLKNGMGTYSGSKIDFELVGYYTQFAALLDDLNNYPYFISINKFEITPYQYDKKILIGNVSIVLYSKR